MKQGKTNLPLLWFTKLMGVLPGLLLLFKPRVLCVDKRIQGKRLPKGSILMSNHKSLMDFALYLCLFWRHTIRFLMAEVLFKKGKAFAWMLFSLGGIFVDRDAFDFSFMNESIQTLDRGGIVGIFPEGRLPVNGKSWPFKPSIVYIALHSGAPIIPVYTDGNYGLTKRATVVIGTPIRLEEQFKGQNPTEQELARLTSYLEEKMGELKEFAQKNGN